jgi:hypothetical protein
MKLHHLPTLCAALLALSAGPAAAQTTAVPNFISYQGTVVNAEGTKVGVGTPVNRTVIFRIWDNPSSTAIANLMYSEAQVVTISDGEFSVLVGQGEANLTTTFGYNEAAKFTNFAGAFNGSARYLGVTVAAAAAIVAGDNEITPRQQIVSTPFAMRARFAESIGSSSDLTLTPLSGTASNYGLGWYGTGRLFGTTAVDGPVLYGNAGGALGSNASGTQKIALNWDASGRVGIGATSINSPTNKLTLQGDMPATPGDQLAIRGNTDNNKRLLLGYDTTANKASLQSYTAAATTGPLLLNPSGGNVGINKVDPSVALDVTGAIKASGDLTAANVSTAQISASSRVMTNSLEFWGTGGPGGALWQKSDTTWPKNTSAVNGEMVLMGNPKLHLATAMNGAAVMTLSGSNVGINKPAPTVALDVEGGIRSTGRVNAQDMTTATLQTSSIGILGTVDENYPLSFGAVTGDKINLYNTGNTNLYYGFGMQLNQLQIRVPNTTGDIVFGHGPTGELTEVMRIKGNGSVGIGTTTPTQARLVIKGQPGAKRPINSPGTMHLLYPAGGQANATDSSTFQSSYEYLSIHADKGIQSSFSILFSDERIKKVVGLSDSGKDLKTLQEIEVTDYFYKDVAEQGSRPHKKVIAQQVERVFPQAVSRSILVVPDIYEAAAIKDGWVTLKTDLKVGERVRLIAESEEGLHEVLEIKGDSFRTAFKSAGDKVFVYGREVDDFRSVDYDAISMLNVSATQQLKREKDAEIQALRDENAALRRELAAKDASLEARLIALERRVSEGTGTEAKTISLKTTQAAK